MRKMWEGFQTARKLFQAREEVQTGNSGGDRGARDSAIEGTQQHEGTISGGGSSVEIKHKCERCGKEVSKTNKARHEKNCKKKEEEKISSGGPPENEGRSQCAVCGEWKAKSYIRRHEQLCRGRKQ